MTTPPPIAILRSVIAPEAISQYLEKELGFVQVKCRFLHHGFNDTYEAESNGRPFIVRLYRHGWRSAEEVEAECRILSELAQAGVSVSTPFAGPAGGFQFSLPAPEGLRICVVFSMAQGNIPLHLDIASTRRLGNWLGNLHAQLDLLVDQGAARPVLGTDFFLEQPLKVLRDAFQRHAADLRQLEHKLRKGMGPLPPFSGAAPDFGLIHGDFLRVNFFQDNSGGMTLFDFDFCGFSHRSYDLATYKWSLLATEDLEAEKSWEEFLTGYQACHPLCSQELGYVDWFVQVRQLWVWGVNVATGDGFQRLNEHQFRARLAWFDL